MGKTTVQSVAEDLSKLVTRQQVLETEMRMGMIGRRKAYEAMKKIRDDLAVLVGRLGSM